MTLEKSDGTFTHTKNEIMSVIESFYARLYTPNVKLSREPFLSNIDFQNVLDNSKLRETCYSIRVQARNLKIKT